jgi:hypothetical protein
VAAQALLDKSDLELPRAPLPVQQQPEMLYRLAGFSPQPQAARAPVPVRVPVPAPLQDTPVLAGEEDE